MEVEINGIKVCGVWVDEFTEANLINEETHAWNDPTRGVFTLYPEPPQRGDVVELIDPRSWAKEIRIHGNPTRWR